MANILRIAAIMLVASSPIGSWQLTIDATNPGPGLRRVATAGSYGSIAGELPLHITLKVTPTPEKEAGTMEVDFLLTNTGQDPVVLPVSPNPRGIEPSDPHTAYRMTVMTLSVSPDATFKSALRGGATLYGNESHPNTLFAVPPGQSVRVITRVAIPALAGKKSSVLFGYVGMQEETVTTYRDKTTSAAQGLGSAISAAFSY